MESVVSVWVIQVSKNDLSLWPNLRNSNEIIDTWTIISNFFFFFCSKYTCTFEAVEKLLKWSARLLEEPWGPRYETTGDTLDYVHTASYDRYVFVVSISFSKQHPVLRINLTLVVLIVYFYGLSTYVKQLEWIFFPSHLCTMYLFVLFYLFVDLNLTDGRWWRFWRWCTKSI